MEQPTAVRAGLPHDNARAARLAASDRQVAVLSLFMWAGTAVKVYPLISTVQNVQSCLGLIAMFCTSVLWPTLSLGSYSRWRTANIACLRLFLFGLPFNFNTAVFDAIAPVISTGRLALVANVFQLFLGCRVALLTFCGLGWRVPFYTHMLLQAAQVGMLVAWAVRPYCDGKLMMSAEINQAAAGVHHLLALLARPLLPPSAALLVPQGEYARRVALLLLSWVLLGWLLPTLLLLPDEAAPSQQQEPQQGQQEAGSGGGRGIRGAMSAAVGLAGLYGDRAGKLMEQLLRQLSPARWQRGGDELPARVACLLRWWVLLLLTWCVCCTVAPLYVPPGAK